ncbi:hypothetical protein IPZ68_30625 [Streptomyces arenae]|nr:hypothetical protein [Streptomyces arenae]
MESSRGVISVDYSQFYVMEEVESDSAEIPHVSPDFASEKPVLLAPGYITMSSEVHWHYAPVTLCLVSAADELPSLGDQWAHLDSVEYRPVYRGRMRIFGCTTGPADPEVRLKLRPDRTYMVHVYAKGRDDARARWEQYLDDNSFEDEYREGDSSADEDGFDDFHEQVFEEYLIAFSPLGYQEPLPPADRPWYRRSRSATPEAGGGLEPPSAGA